MCLYNIHFSMFKKVFYLVTLLTNLLIGQQVFAQCPNDIDIKPSDYIAVNNAQKVKLQDKSKIITKQGIFSCNSYIGAAGISLFCDNKSTIEINATGTELIAFLKDVNNSEFLMNVVPLYSFYECNNEEFIVFKEGYKIFQQSFNFEVHLEIYYERRKVKKPVGF